jgi:succinoglycan biosynthesis protein ExoV
MLYYCRTEEGNFGDELNPWLWSRLAPEVCDERASALFVGIGTILGHRIPAEPLKMVFGAGCGYTRPPVIDGRWKFFAVRGPLTAARLGLDPSTAVTDSAVLVRSTHLPAPKKRYAVSFMPHHKSLAHADWAALCARASLHFLDPRHPVERVLDEILASDLLLAEAMHGAVVADALRVPWIPVRMYSQVLEFKWRDWTQSIGLPFRFADVPPVFENDLPWGKKLAQCWKMGWGKSGLGKEKWKRLQIRRTTEREIGETLRILQGLSRSYPPCLSADSMIEQREQTMLAQLADLRASWPRL